MIERTQDYRIVKRITNENPMEGTTEWDLTISDKVFYLLEVVDGNALGVWAFEPAPDGSYEMHAAMGKDCRGAKAVQSGLNAISWLYENTKCNDIVAPVPVHLKHAQRIPRCAGLVYRGIDEGRKIYTMDRNLFKEIQGSK
jgi:hypothetical protein